MFQSKGGKNVRRSKAKQINEKSFPKITRRMFSAQEEEKLR